MECAVSQATSLYAAADNYAALVRARCACMYLLLLLLIDGAISVTV